MLGASRAWDPPETKAVGWTMDSSRAGIAVGREEAVETWTGGREEWVVETWAVETWAVDKARATGGDFVLEEPGLRVSLA